MQQGEIIYLGVFGSKLYGTSTPESDNDYKQVHQATLEEIVLKKSLTNINNSTNTKTRNTKDDIDFESKELRQFILDCLEGQTYAFDMIFTPRDKWVKYSKTWEELVELRDKLVNKNVKPFLGYCRGQAIKYSLKGTKLKKLHIIMDAINASDGNKLTVSQFINNNPDLLTLDGVKKFNKEFIKGDKIFTEEYIDIVQSSFPGNRQLSDIIPSIKLQMKNYGERSIKAMNDEGIDLKAYYHALRICWELEEYLETGKITFPCPRADFLLKVRKGLEDKNYIEQYINDEINRVMLIPNNLKEADNKFWDDWIVHHYLKR